jgi:hypothetical protein
MYEVVFYRDKNGNEPIAEYIDALRKKTDKSSRINYNKTIDFKERSANDGNSEER